MDKKALPEIDVRYCDACGECVEVCPYGALVIADGAAAVAPGVEDCEYCGKCEEVCHTGAITCPYEIILEG